jgi:Rieske Fe-S protein
VSSESKSESLPVCQERRDFLDGALVGGMVLLAGSALYPIVRYLSAPVAEEAGSLEVVAAKVSEVAAGTALAFRFGDKPALLVRDQDGMLHGLIAICTHLECVVKFRPDLGHIFCACHNGHFDLTGRNIQGPPPRPLARLEVEVRGQDIVVRRA